MTAAPGLAFVTPLPPSPSGIADYSLDVAAALDGRYLVDFFCDQPEVDGARLPAGSAWHAPSELQDRHGDRRYRLTVYQLGNSPAHASAYALLPRVPGLVVLHELVLHHARARLFLDSPEARAYSADPSSTRLRDAAKARLQGYRDELAHDYPEQAERLFEAQLNSVGTLLPYAYPLFRLPVEAARVVAVHNGYMARALREQVPETPVVRVPMPVEPQPVPPEAVAALRARLGLAPEHVVLGCFGLLTPEKRVLTVARAVARAAASQPNLRLLLVGEAPDEPGLRTALERLGLRGRVHLAGRVPFEELATHLQAVDLAAHLRYPTARETSAALLRLLAQGRPTLISDLEHQAEIPDEAVLRLDVSDEEGELTRGVLRLLARPDLRARMSRAAVEYVRREHAPAQTARAYADAIEQAAALPDPEPRPGWPAHWRQAAAER